MYFIDIAFHKCFCIYVRKKEIMNIPREIFNVLPRVWIYKNPIKQNMGEMSRDTRGTKKKKSPAKIGVSFQQRVNRMLIYFLFAYCFYCILYVYPAFPSASWKSHTSAPGFREHHNLDANLPVLKRK